MSSPGPERKRQRLALPDEGAQRSSTFARWCQISPGGSTHWDETKIKNLLSEEELDDTPRMHALLSGKDGVLNSRLHPLILDNEALEGDARLRSLPFLRALLNDKSAAEEYQALDIEKKRIVALSVRDLYLAFMADLLDNEEKNLLRAVANILDESIGHTTIDNMTVSFHPSANFKVLKFIQDLPAKTASLTTYFAQVLTTPALFAVFVDPAELSYHNFENIIPLDSRVSTEPSLSLTSLTPVSESNSIYTATLQGTTTSLSDLPFLPLFIPPLNPLSRGGTRYIFSSTNLSRAITKAITTSPLLSLLPPNLVSTNYIFRCNRFTPASAPFKTHLDTPYFDSAQNHISKYTVLIYLTSGSNPSGVLTIGETSITSVDEFTVVIFPQDLTHSGNPFIEGDKVFLRTELIFVDENLVRGKKEVRSLFSTAVYMTAQSVFDEELERYAGECYERVSRMHWGDDDRGKKQVLLGKRFGGVKFVTDGCGYWVEGGDLLEGVVVAVLDYLNCVVAGKPFREVCGGVKVEEAGDVWEVLKRLEVDGDGKVRRLGDGEVDGLFRMAPGEEFKPRDRPSWMDEDEDEDGEDDEDINEGCCPFHTWKWFDAWKSEDVMKEYKKCCGFARKKLLGVPLMMLGSEVVLNEKNIRVEGDKILFMGEGRRLNFAACWGDSEFGAEVYVGVEKEVQAPKLLIPPIIWRKHEREGFHFVLDFWRNDWAVNVDTNRKIAVPVVTNEVPEELADKHLGGPFWRKVKELGGEEEGSYWTRESDDDDSEVEDDEDEQRPTLGYELSRWGFAQGALVIADDPDNGHNRLLVQDTFLGFSAQFSLLPYVKAKAKANKGCLNQRTTESSHGLPECAIFGYKYFLTDASSRRDFPEIDTFVVSPMGLEDLKAEIHSFLQTRSSAVEKEYYEQVAELLAKKRTMVQRSKSLFR
ncbi:hypothetical protein OQA88_810 [Cercophora sp. LCS_1]